METTIPAAADAADAVLVKKALRGNRPAFDLLVGRHQRQALAVAYRLLGDAQEAQDVTQEAYLRAYRSLNSLRQPEAFGGWLMRIVANLSLNQRRKRKNRTVSLETSEAQAAASDKPDALACVAGTELGARLNEALAELPERQRMAILLFTVEQMPQRQVAKVLGCTVEAVKWHVFQGRRRLRTLLADHL